MKHYSPPARADGEGAVSHQAARNRHRAEIAERQVRDLTLELARIRKLAKQQGVSL